MTKRIRKEKTYDVYEAQGHMHKKYAYYSAASSAKNFYDAIAPARYEV